MNVTEYTNIVTWTKGEMVSNDWMNASIQKGLFSSGNCIKTGRDSVSGIWTYKAQDERNHSCDVIMSPMASQITGVATVHSTFVQAQVKKTHQSCASLAFVGVLVWSTVKCNPDARVQPGYPSRVILREFRVQMSILSLSSIFVRSSYATLKRRKVLHRMASKSNTLMRVHLGISMSSYLQGRFDNCR